MAKKPAKWTFSEVAAMAKATDRAWWNGLTPAEQRAAARAVNETAASEAKIRAFLTLKPVPGKGRKR